MSDEKKIDYEAAIVDDIEEVEVKKKPIPPVPPTKYQGEETDEQVYKLCLLGLTDKEISGILDIAESTFYEWKKEYPSLSEAIKKGKEIADSKVAERLYQRALGYEHEAVELKVVSLGDNQGSEVQEIPVIKKYAPDPISAIFWLKNRQPEKWRDKQEVKVTGDMVIDIKLEEDD